MTTSRDVKAHLKANGINTKNIRCRCSHSSIDIYLKSFEYTPEEVRELCRKFESVSYCEYTQEILQGGNTFLFASYDYDFKTSQQDLFIDHAKEILNKIEEHPSFLGHKIWRNDWHHGELYISKDDKSERVCDNPHALAFELALIHYKENLKPEEPAQEKTTVEISSNSETTVKINEEKDGVEIFFAEIPTKETRELLKENGFRWHRRNKCWYNKNTEENRAFALQFTTNTTEEVETVDVEEIIEEIETPADEIIEIEAVTETVTPEPVTDKITTQILEMQSAIADLQAKPEAKTSTTIQAIIKRLQEDVAELQNNSSEETTVQPAEVVEAAPVTEIVEEIPAPALTLVEFSDEDDDTDPTPAPKKKSVPSIVKELKENDQDFEFYPTTDEILSKVYTDGFISAHRSYYRRNDYTVLDIGAGNGTLYNYLAKRDCKPTYQVIEKSKILRDMLPDTAVIVGTDFMQQTLLDKKADITFCNPPYKQFVEWSAKIIKESCSKSVYLVIPDRWRTFPAITTALESREAEAETLGSFSFHDAERKARANVELIKITYTDKNADPLVSSIQQMKEGKENNEEKTFTAKSAEEKKTILSALTKKKHFIEALYELYQEDMKRIHGVFHSIAKVDDDLFAELDISVEQMVTALRNKMSSTKAYYWNKLFDYVPEIHKKLTTNNIQKVVETITQGHILDFEPGNMYDIISRVLENVNNLINDQVTDLYKDLVSRCCSLTYKSNQKIDLSEWKYRSGEVETPETYLENRVIYNAYNFLNGFIWDSGKGSRLSDNSRDFFSSFLVVARNLGFAPKVDDFKDFIYNSLHHHGKKYALKGTYKGKEITLLEYKGHLKGTIHFKFNQKFMQALNIEAGRLLGWIHSANHASDCIKNVSKKDAKEFYGAHELTKLNLNTHLQLDNCKLLA